MITEVTGYDSAVRFYATRYKQGGRTVFSLDLALTQIAELLPAPNPANPTEGNRRIKESHARAFGDYVRSKSEWVAPALVLRAPDIFHFEVRESIGGTEFGVISFPRLASTDIRILDGQHRILGVHLAIRGIADDLERARTLLAAGRRQEAEPAVIHQMEETIQTLTQQRERFGRERTSLQVFIEDDQVAFKQMFFDIADNALGITSSVRARFDSRKVVNRSLEDVMKHALLRGRVDPEQDRVGRNNPNLMGAKHVAEIVRTVAVGIDGRISRRLEDELREDALVQKTNDFLDALISAFPPLEAVADETMTPEELRRTSLLGSMVMIRVLAGVYAEMVDGHGLDDEDVTEFFRKIAPHMQGPVTSSSVWVTQVKEGENVFSPGALAPRSRRQDLKTLRDTMVGWAITDPRWLRQPKYVA
jgi:DNA-sulfur modification-associated